MKKIFVLLLWGLASNALGQDVKEAPIVLTRTPAESQTLDAAALQKKIQSDLAGLKQVPVPTEPPPGTNGANVSVDKAPSDFRPPQDISLSATAEAAVRVSEKWLSDTVTPAPGPDGRVLYTYGAGLATVVCAPLRVCTIELQTGEHLVDEPHIGDAVRWHIAPATYGRDKSSTTIVVIKPQEPGLDTNLLLPTDRRIYYVRLVSKPEDYTARVAFAYPEDELMDQRWQEHLAKQEQERKEATRIAEVAPAALETMNFNYQITGDPAIRPLMVFDDGSKTFIRMNPEVQHRQLPILVAIGRDGKGEMLNYRVKNDLYIADRLFDRAALILGENKKSQRVEIRRGNPER
jgi:type IV secretion system protein VirB9